MKISSVLIAFAFATLCSVPVFAEPAADTLIGTVQIRNTSKLDSQAKKELAAIVARIKKKQKNGAVKLIGNVPAAGSPEEYLTKSFLLAKSVENHLASLLKNQYQIFLAASSADNRGDKNSVSVYLYPYELKAEGLRFISSQLRYEITSEGADAKGAGAAVAPQASADDAAATAKSPSEPVPAESALSAPLGSDSETGRVTSRKEREKVETEDAVQANELVNRAKARAAEKARRKESQD